MNENDHPTTPQWLPLSTAAEQVGRSVKTLRRWVKDGKIPARMESGRWMVNIADVSPPKAGVITAPGIRPAAELQPLLTTISEMSAQLQQTIERAAIAETKNAFLEERLAELRERYEPTEAATRVTAPGSERRWWQRSRNRN